MSSRRSKETNVNGIFWLAVFLLAICSPSPAQEPVTAITCGSLIDGKGGPPLENVTLLVNGNRISAVGKGIPVPPAATRIDLSGYTVLPGLIDCHTHIASEPGNYLDDLFRDSPIDDAIVVYLHAAKTLQAGFTTIRDLGSPEFIDVSARNAIDAGKMPGPRILAATLAVGSTGGHNDITGFSPYLSFAQFSGIANGVDEIRKLVRFEIKNGADVIKMIATAGVLTEEESVGAPQYSMDEMKAVVEEAAMWGKKVAAHAHGAEGIKMAVRAGVASIEHGSLLDDEGIRLMKERGTYLVADVYNDDFIIAEYRRLGYPDKIIEKEKLVGRQQRENFQKAVKAGVKIAYGTDAGVYPHGDNGKQFAHMVKWGMTPMHAIVSATTSAADLLGWKGKVGEISTGAYADIVALKGDPLKDISLLEHVRFVMKNGKVVKHEQ